MSKFDAECKNYLSIPVIFADAFNFLIFHGDPVIKATDLHPVDTSELAIPYGNGARIPIQRTRDKMKVLSAMMDDKAIYVLLGAEAQMEIHYAMPVKNMTYDAINYASQVSEAARSYRKSGEIVVDEDEIKIKLSPAEFLSGFRKGDKLIPIITAVIYFGPEEWDGPLSLHEMMDVPDQRMLRLIPNYFINLIAPAGIDDNDFDKFHTDFGLVMKVIKHQKDSAVKIIQETEHRKIDRSTAEFLNSVVNLGLTFEEEGDVDMCLAMEKNNLRMKIEGAIEMLHKLDTDDDQIIKQVAELFSVSEDYVRSLMAPVAV